MKFVLHCVNANTVWGDLNDVSEGMKSVGRSAHCLLEASDVFLVDECIVRSPGKPFVLSIQKNIYHAIKAVPRANVFYFETSVLAEAF